eukprot:1145625-Pelagomonas_calceolata.AAC.7
MRAPKFADAMWSRTCTPDLRVWVREPLVHGLVLIAKGEQVNNEWQEQFAWRTLSNACMREHGMVSCRKVLLLP